MTQLAQFPFVLSNGPGNLPDADQVMANWQHIRTYINGGGIGANELENDAIVTAKLADDAVTNPKIADSAVDTVKLADDAVTNDKLNLSATQLASNSNMSLTLTDGVIPNLSSAPLDAGTYLAWLHLDLRGTTPDTTLCVAHIQVNGVNQGGAIVGGTTQTSANAGASTAGMRIVSVGAGQGIRAVARDTVGSASGTIISVNTTLTFLRTGP